ncbi:MAG TPA: hypothetical protein VGM84_13835 [Steroidobacteraceae bacterium]|jgi:BASS family bile acid:Na+ symporter
MNIAALVRILVLVSLGLIVLSLGLRGNRGDAAYLFHRPRLLLRSLLTMNVVMPIFAIWLVVLLDLRPAVKVALVVLSVSPVAPFFPGKALKLTQRQGYIYGLLVASAALAVILVPISTRVLSYLALSGLPVAGRRVLEVVAPTILVPFALGAIVRRLIPESSERLARICGLIGNVVLLVAVVLILIGQAAPMAALLGDGTLVAIAVYTCVGLLVGHLLGGPDAQDRTVLALATVTRHPAVALAAAAAVFPVQSQAPAAILLALIVSVLAAAPYVVWRRKHADHDTRNEGGSLQHP